MSPSLQAGGTVRRQPLVLYQPRERSAAMPLGLLALGSWLELEGRHVVIVDGRFELAPEARVAELARSALLLWVNAPVGPPLGEALRVSRAARVANPDLPVIWSGPHVLVDPESCLASGAVDACAPGAGEEPLQALVAALRSHRPLASVPGVQLRGGALVQPTPPPTRLWPRAHYGLLDVERYFEERGAHRLDYCSSRGVREVPEWMGLRPERVVGETLELEERYRVTELCFSDEDFFADAERVAAIADGLAEAGRRLGWRASVRPDDVLEAEPQTLRRLAASGCKGLELEVVAGERERLLETGRRLHDAGLGGTFVFRVSEDAAPGTGLAAAVSVARRLCAMDGRFVTPIRKRRIAPQRSPGRSLEEWARLEPAPWKDALAEARLQRTAFYFAEAQRAPGRRLGKQLLKVLALLRVRLGFFSLDFERAVVELSALVRTGRPRPAPGD